MISSHVFQSTAEYHSRLTVFFKTWVYGDVVTPPSFVLPPPEKEARYNPLKPILANFTNPASNETFEVIPDCIPTVDFEENCYDGIDDDCNGE